MSDKELRTLDAWVAKHVFEWTDIKMENAQNEVSPFKPPYGRSPVGYSRLPHFSSFRSDAMLVLEKCAEHDSWPEFTRLNHVEPKGSYVWYWNGTEYSATTLPLAICKYAKQLFSK